MWIGPTYIACNIYSYYNSQALWESANKKNKVNNGNCNTDNWKYISELLYGFLLSFAYYIQSVVIWYIVPTYFLSVLTSVILFSWTISWSVFEYRFIHANKDLFQRIRHFERRWLYFLGFGLPLSVLYHFLSRPISLSIWFIAIAFLTLRAIVVKPLKSPKLFGGSESEIKSNSVSTNNDGENVTDVPRRRKPVEVDGRRLRVLFVSQIITTYIIKKIVAMLIKKKNE